MDAFLLLFFAFILDRDSEIWQWEWYVPCRFNATWVKNTSLQQQQQEAGRVSTEISKEIKEEGN